jgi:hypothetical protein
MVSYFCDSMIPIWSFEQFRSANDRDAVSDWRRGLSPARRAIMDVFLNRIAKMQSWPSGTCNPLTGYPGYWELRWTAEKVEHRIFGYYAGPRKFVMLIGCTHKGKVYDPPSAFQTMQDRKGKLTRGEGTLSIYEA